MDKLKDYIKNNRSQFDDMAPTDGHMERFTARLNAQKKQPKRSVRTLITVISGVAAAVLITLMLLPLGKTEDNTCMLSPELAEVSSYYAIRLEQEIDKVQQLAAFTDEETKAELLSDIMTMREESNKFLHQLCASHIDEADSLPIIVKHYQSKIEALQTTVYILENRTRA